VTLLRRLGFDLRIRGSHHIFTKEHVDEIINLQPVGSKAKACQTSRERLALGSCDLSSTPQSGKAE